MTSLSPQDNIAPTLVEIATATLDAMVKIAAKAGSQYTTRNAGAGDVMGVLNILNNPAVGQNLNAIQDQSLRAAYELSREPLIARVRTRAVSGHEKIFYFGRNFTVTVDGLNMTSYNSGAPVARLAALDIGDSFVLPGNVEVEVIESGTYVPKRLPDGWDGTKALISHEEFDQVSVASLRLALQHKAVDDSDPFAGLNQPVIWAKPQRETLSGIGLRDQAIMNKVQDEIFRLPINRQVMLEGPPGTGKTTTLIKRLSQKLVETPDRPEDMQIIAANRLDADHRNSWIMFSPTELLEHYLREAFAIDNVPASRQRIQTWAGFRNDLAVRVLGLLRSGARRSGFQREEVAQYLSPHAVDNQPGLYAAFDQAQRQIYRAELDAAMTALAESDAPELQDMALRLRSRLPASASILSIYLAVDAQSEGLRAWVATARDTLNAEVIRRIDVMIRRRRDDIPHLNALVAKMDTTATDDDTEDEDDGLDTETPPATPKDRIMQVWRGAIRAMAMAAWHKRAVPRNSVFRSVIDWMGEDAIAEADLVAMGRVHALIAAVARVTLTTRNYFTKLPARYRSFRRAAPAPWYLPEAAEAVRLTYDELDLLVAVHLEAAHELISSQQVRGNLTQGNLQVLAPLRAEFRNQVVVDEATDFTPLQLRAMASLATPGIRSFFACGDFNQRLNRHGVSQHSAMAWAVPGLEFHRVDIAYRQSKELRDFANRLVQLAGGDTHETVIDGPRAAEGYAPTVYANTGGGDGQSRWMAGRISEIADMHRTLPSVAVFVPSEGMVGPVTQELRLALQETNIEVMACPGGQVLGRENHVRVFAVSHIKGLEFEAAFFHSVQDLAQDMPDLFDKFLYVGATRAATFLGLACDGDLPEMLKQATQGLRDSWSAAA